MFVPQRAAGLDRFTTFGDLLRYLRRRVGLTQRQFSIAVGYSDSQISRLEQNERAPDLTTIAARFGPVLALEDEPEVFARLLDLAVATQVEAAPVPGQPPFKGLQCFEEADAGWFFGREALVGRLAARLARPPAPSSEASGAMEGGEAHILTLVGASGSGKSSVVRAGLVPTLRRAGWDIRFITPTSHPLTALAISVLGASGRGPAGRPLAEEMARDAGALGRALTAQAALTSGFGPTGDRTTLLVVDQLEELFTLCHDLTERSAFIANLLTAAHAPSAAIFVLLALRADFYGHCAAYPALRDALARYQDYIGPMTADELRRAIEAPARRGAWELEPGLVYLILRDLGAEGERQPEPGALPLLSHALLETWERRRGRTLTLAGYQACGGVRGAIAETAEAVLRDRLDAPQRAIARQIFLRLTELGEATESRRRARFDELVSRPEDEPVVREVIQVLVDARLIITEQDTAEVAHEALIREWPTLRAWLEENRDGLRLHRRLTEAAQAWETDQRDPGGLYRGARLAQAQEWAAGGGADLNVVERDFLAASDEAARREEAERESERQRQLAAAQKLAEAEQRRADEQRRTAVRLRRRALILGLSLVAAVIMAGAAVYFGDQTNRNALAGRSRELAAQATANLAVDPERSILLALEAVSVAQSAGLPIPREAEEALHQAVLASRVEVALSAQGRQFVASAFSPDGLRLATARDDGLVQLWAAATGTELLSWRPNGSSPVHDLAFSPDGTRLAIAGGDDTARVWSLAPGSAGRELLSVSGDTGAILRVAFSPDGTRLITAGEDPLAAVWDLASGRRLYQWHGPIGIARRLTLAPDGTRLVTADSTGARVWSFAPGAAEDASVRELPGQPFIRVFNEFYSLPRQRASMYIRNDGIALSPDGTRLATAALGQAHPIALIADVATGQILNSLLGHWDSINAMAFSPDGTRLATGSLDYTARIWDAATGRELLVLPGHTGEVTGVLFSPDGTRLATLSMDGTARVWYVGPSREVMALPIPAGAQRWIAVTQDGRRLATGGVDGKPRIWDLSSGKLLLEMAGHGHPIVDVAFSPDGQQLATGGDDYQATVWDAQTGRELYTVLGNWLAYSPDGSRLITSDIGFARIFEASTGRELNSYVANSCVHSPVFSPDGHRLAFGESGAAIVRDPTTGRILFAFKDPASCVIDLAFSPDGTRLVTASNDGVKVWSVEPGLSSGAMVTASVRTLRTPTLVNSVAYDHTGARLATANVDGTATVWDALTGQDLLTLSGGGWVWDIAFSPDGKYLLTGGEDAAHIYLVHIADLVALARTRVTRTWTADECVKYLRKDPATCALLAAGLTPSVPSATAAVTTP